ncbi:hypothetical protein PIB30_102289, partial [Stylosanthes scabra]|nr:hypothetical protein [Stylosanthes scabra]
MSSTIMRHMLLSLLLFLSTQAVLSAVTPLQFQHPLDPLTKDEIATVQTIVHAKYPTSKNSVTFHYIGLDDPDKTTLLTWDHLNLGSIIIPRKSFVIAIINTQTHEIVIDLRLKLILSDKIHTGHGFPTLSVEEQSAAILLPLSY